MASRLIPLLLLASVAVAGDPPVGRLISREVYDWNGKRVGLEEYSDVRQERPQIAKVKAEPLHTVGELRLHNGVYWRLRADGGWDYCTECNQTTGGVSTVVPLQSSPVFAPPVTYVPTTYAAPVYTAPVAYPVYSYPTYSGIGAGVRFGGFRAGIAAGGG